MTIEVNGEARQVIESATIQSLLDEMKLSPQRVAVERNRRLVKTDNYGQSLQTGDRLEIVTFVGGG